MDRLSAVNIQFAPMELDVLSKISADAGGQFTFQSPQWYTALKLLRTKVLMRSGPSKPKFFFSDPYFAAVVLVQQTEILVDDLVSNLRGRGLESLVAFMLPAILKQYGLDHLVRPQLFFCSSSSLGFLTPSSTQILVMTRRLHLVNSNWSICTPVPMDSKPR
jgi:hypothetical protein